MKRLSVLLLVPAMLLTLSGVADAQTTVSASIIDCASTFINYVAYPTELAVEAARGCMEPWLQTAFQPDTTAPLATRVERVGESKTLDGYELVFYVVDQDGQTNWYVIALDTAGMVSGIE